ncbi:MAG: translocation/assembly module TamB domain-containing protein [Candidatus Cloacimonetes bacterium]|nr:translocation/assembly module TamB domain-containing protein [Candidatus Cloacimonadota bacterium]
MRNKRIKLKYKFIIILTSFILILNLLFLSLRFSETIQDRILKSSLEIINNKLNGYISYDNFSGNLFTQFKFSNLNLADSLNKNIITLDSLTISWDYKKLFNKQLQINEIKLYNLSGNLIRYQSNHQSHLNLTEVFPQQQKQKIKPYDNKTKTPFNINIKNIIIDSTNVTFHTNDSNHRILIDFLQTSFKLSNETIISKLCIENISTLNPELNIEKIDGDLALEDNILDISHFDIFTNNSMIKLKGNANIDNLKKGELNLILNPLNLSDFKDIIDIPGINEPLILKTKINLYPNKTTTIMEFVHNSAEANLYGIINHNGRLKEMNISAINNYRFNLKLKNFEPLLFVPNIKTIPQLSINGQISIDGSGTKLNDLNIQNDITLNNIYFNDSFIDSLSITNNLNRLSLASNLKFLMLNDSTNIPSEIDAKVFIDNIKEEQNFNIKLNTTNLNINTFVHNLISRLNLQVNIQGKGFNLNKMNAQAKIELRDSMIANQKIDKFLITSDYTNNIININKFELFNDNISISGNYKFSNRELIKSESKIYLKTFQNIAQNLNLIKNDETLDFKAFIYLNAKGKWNNLQGYSFISLKDILYNEYSIKNIENYLYLKSLKSFNIYSNTTINAVQNIKNNQQLLDTLQIKIQNIDNTAKIILDAEKNNLDKSILISDNYKIALETNLNWKKNFKNITAEIPLIKISHPLVNWENIEIPEINIKPNHIFINNFNLYSDKQHIVINHFAKDYQTLKLDLNINNLDINKTLKLLNQNLNIQGIINIDSKILLDNFSILPYDSKNDSYLDLKIKNLNYENISLGDINLKTQVTNKLSSLNILLSLYDQKYPKLSPLILYANIPLTSMDLNKMKVSQKDSLNINLQLQNIETKKFNKFLPGANQLNGILNMDFNFSGSLSKPQTSGDLNISSGRFTNDILGIDFQNINSHIGFKDNKLNINTLSFEGGKGTFNTQGFVKIKTKNDSISIEETNIAINMNKLQVIKSKLAQAILSTDIQINDNNKKELSIKGNITSQEIRIFLDEILKMDNIKTISEPILIKTLKEKQDLHNNKNLSKEKIQNKTKTPRAMNFTMPIFTAAVRIELPRNVWVLGDDINIELKGDVLVIIDTNNKQIIQLDGFIEINRGYYQFLGKRFYFEEGKASFISSNLDNPELKIKANYIFRNPYGIKQTITLNLTGTAKSPTISFSLDNNDIEEKEAISLIVFGRGSEQLTQNEEQAVTQNTDELDTATALLAGQLSGQLSSLLQRQLNLDMIEISGDNQWQQASLTVGRYFGNNLFVSYEKGFDFSDFKALKTDKINIEYQINKYFFLNTIQGSGKENGIDLIFKIQSNK